MKRTSRIPGFYKQSVEARRRLLAEAADLDNAELTRVLAGGGMDVAGADKTVENVLGTYALPFSLGLNAQVNGVDRLVPMVVEEPSVVAAASNAAKMIRDGGGFEAESDAPLMVAQVQLWEVRDPLAATARVLAAERSLLAMADAALPSLVARGGGARAVEPRDLGDGLFVVHVVVDVCDAMGANLVNTVAEALAPTVAALTGGVVGLRILSNLSDKRCVRVRCRVPCASLATAETSGEAVRDGVVLASSISRGQALAEDVVARGIAELQRSWQPLGRVRFVMTDSRSARDPRTVPEPQRTMLGAPQDGPSTAYKLVTDTANALPKLTAADLRPRGVVADEGDRREAVAREFVAASTAGLEELSRDFDDAALSSAVSPSIACSRDRFSPSPNAATI